MLEDFRERLTRGYRAANRRSGGTIAVLKNTFSSFNDARGSQAAASIAYYTFFSIFPLLIALIAAGSLVLESQQVYRQITEFLLNAFPASEQLIQQNLDRVLSLRGPVGVVGLASLIWSGTNVFAVLAFNINQAWPDAEARNLLEKRLVGLGMLGALVGLLILSLLSTVALDLLQQFQVPLLGNVAIYETPLWSLVSGLLPWLFPFLMFLGLYLWVPSVEVRPSAALWGALAAVLGWRLATWAFTWYLSSGLAQYELVYGSLGTVVALMFWIYLSSVIILFGAHLSGAVDQWADEAAGAKGRGS